MSTGNMPPKNEKKASINSVRSREQLLELDSAYFAHEMRTMKQRRTKILATLCEPVSSVDDIREFLLSGMNIIRVNMAYCSQKALELIMKNKSFIEKEQGCFIPVIMDLKGNTLRLGSFDLPGGEISLKKGQEFRISTNKKIKGNEHIISCDCPNLGKMLQEGDTILVDYGRNVFVVKRIEKESETIAYLGEKYPNKQGKSIIHKKLAVIEGSSVNDYQQCFTSNDEENSDGSPKSQHSIEEKAEDEGALKHGEENMTPEKPERVSHRKKFLEAFKKKKKVEKDVIVCEAVSDCAIQSSKPIFIHQRDRGNPKTMKRKSFNLADDEPDIDEEPPCINVKDIKDLNLAVELDVDAVAITGVTSKKDIEEARFILGTKSHIRVIAKIQTRAALENFDEILEASDGIIIARNYLSLQMPVEKLFFKQKEMIYKCHAVGKPVTIVSQVLDSMVMGLVPTSSEINDIANLILDGIDSITLITETTYGLHRKASLETLSRLCYEIEYNEILSKQQQMRRNESIPRISSFSINQKDNNALMQEFSKNDPTPPPTISGTIAACVIKAVHDLQASLIVAFTQSGSTVLKMSKLRSPCPIIAVTNSEKVARQVSLLASVTAIKVGSMFGKEGVTQKVLGIAKEKNWVKEGEYIVMSFGEVEGVSGTTNTLRIIKA